MKLDFETYFGIKSRCKKGILCWLGRQLDIRECLYDSNLASLSQDVLSSSGWRSAVCNVLTR